MRHAHPSLAASFRATGMAALAALAVLAPPPGPAHADALSQAAGRYTIGPASQIRFRVDQVGGGGISGSFATFDGSFSIDGKDVSRSSVRFSLSPASVSTGQPRVEAFLRSDAVFDAAEYPKITFRSTSVRRTGENEADVEGLLTARGKSRAARFHVTVSDRAPSRIAFRVTGQVLRSPYGMDVGTPIYSNVVQFDMTLAGNRTG